MDIDSIIAQVQSHLLPITKYVDFDSKLYQFSFAFIAFNPIFWNIVARLEYRTHFLTKAFGGAKKGCYALAFTIFSLGIARDLVYKKALAEQPTAPFLTENPIAAYLGVAFFAGGNVLVLSSMYALGVTGTYLGDYFGILMDERVTGFPFSVTDNPMYLGSVFCFIGTALWYGKPAGIIAGLFVDTMYRVALSFEEPFTSMIYEKRDAEREKKVE